MAEDGAGVLGYEMMLGLQSVLICSPPHGSFCEHIRRHQKQLCRHLTLLSTSLICRSCSTLMVVLPPSYTSQRRVKVSPDLTSYT